MREHVDLPTVAALDAEWRKNPPVHHLVAGYLGYKAPSDDPARVITDIEDIMPALGNVPVRRDIQPVDSSAFDAAMKEKSNGGQ